MTKLSQATEILKGLGFDINKIIDFKTERRRQRILKVFIAVANLKEDEDWKKTKSFKYDKFSIKSREIIAFINNNYSEDIADSSYDDIRRKNLKYLEEANIVLRSANLKQAATNDPMRGYSLSDGVIDIVKSYGQRDWIKKSNEFIKHNGEFSSLLSKTHIRNKPISITSPDGKEIGLSFGEHNEIQKKIVEDFLPYFLKEPILLYLGDTSKKTIILEEEFLNNIGINELKHEMLPDILALDKKENKIYLIEAVHSSNPINQLRYLQLKKFVKKCKIPIVMISAFKNREIFRKYCINLSWDTYVWLTDEPSHIINFK